MEPFCFAFNQSLHTLEVAMMPVEIETNCCGQNRSINVSDIVCKILCASVSFFAIRDGFRSGWLYFCGWYFRCSWKQDLKAAL